MQGSRKQSGTSSRRLPEAPALFLDRSLGSHIIPKRLRYQGLAVEVHDDHLQANATDKEGIALVAHWDWVAATKDQRLRYRSFECTCIKQHSARVMVIAAKRLVKGPEVAELLLRARSNIARLVSDADPPFLAALHADSTVGPYEI